MIVVPFPESLNSKELLDVHKKLVDKAASINADIARLDADEKAFLDADPVEIVLGRREEIRDRRQITMGQELALRNEITQFIADCKAAINVEISKLDGGIDAARAKVQKSLEKIGYYSPIKGAHIPSATTPAMVASHPDVRGLINKRDMAFRELHDLTFTHQNADAIVDLKDKLNRLRAASVV